MSPSSLPSPHRALTLKQRAAFMRQNPTAAELALWQWLKGSKLGVVFRRQVVIGQYIVDFLAPSVRLIVEVDGGCHDTRLRLDASRQRRLERAGYRVVRVTNALVREQPRAAVAVIVAGLPNLGSSQ